MQNNIAQPQTGQQVNTQYQYQTQPVMQPQINYNPVCPQVQQPQIQTQPTQQGQPAQGGNSQVPPSYSGVNIQIFNPSVATPGAPAPTYNVNAPSYPQGPSSYGAGYYTQNYANCTCPNCQNQGAGANGAGANGVNSANLNSINNATNTNTTSKKTEKRNIVVLTDDYIRNLENYLNSQDKEVRLMGAKEVLARLEEDPERKDDKALNALVNKMLQDPSQPVKILALSALDSRIATGDDYTVAVLKNMQNATSGYGQDALSASNILLKMSGQVAEKEFEVKDQSQTTSNTTTTTTTTQQQG